MVPRPRALERIRSIFRVHPVAALFGPRQCGKTTLARVTAQAEDSSTIFDLENPVDRQRLANPIRTLGALEGMVVLDEIQRQPELFEVHRVLVDRPGSTSSGSSCPTAPRGTSTTASQ